MNINENIWEIVVQKLIEQNLTIATMESCTGGGIANEITNVSGASAAFKEGYVTYCNTAKIKQGVDPKVIEEFSVYSKQTALQMANAVRNQTHCDIAIGVTGQLGRIDPANPVNKLNTVWVAFSGKGFARVDKIHVDDMERRKQKEVIIFEVAKKLLSIL